MGTTVLAVVGVAAAVWTLATAFFLHFPEARLGAAVDLGSGFWGLPVSLVAVTVCFSGASVTSLGGGLGCGLVGGEVVALKTRPPSDEVIPTLTQVHLLGRETGPLSFRSGRLACGYALSAMFGRLLCKNRLRFFPLHTATAVRCVVSPAAIALRLFLRGIASRGGSPTSDAPGCISAVTLRVAEALAALVRQMQAYSIQCRGTARTNSSRRGGFT